MKKLKSTVILLFALAMLPSCNIQSPQTTQTTGTTTTPAPEKEEYVYPETALFEKPEPNEAFLAIKDRYSDEILHEMNYFNGTIDQFNERYPIEYRTDDETGTYIVYLGENGKLVCVAFDENGKRDLAGGAAVHSFSCSLYAFTAIQKNMTLAEVEKIDPNGRYWPLYGSGSSRNSLHYTPEGYCVNVTYEKITDTSVPIKERFLVVDVEITIF